MLSLLLPCHSPFFSALPPPSLNCLLLSFSLFSFLVSPLPSMLHNFPTSFPALPLPFLVSSSFNPEVPRPVLRTTSAYTTTSYLSTFSIVYKFSPLSPFSPPLTPGPQCISPSNLWSVQQWSGLRPTHNCAIFLRCLLPPLLSAWVCHLPLEEETGCKSLQLWCICKWGWANPQWL